MASDGNNAAHQKTKEDKMAHFDVYEILTNFPDWEESIDFITDSDVRRDLMLEVEHHSNELAPTAAHQFGSELEFIDLIFNDQVEPSVAIEKLRFMLWTYAKPMTEQFIRDEEQSYVDDMARG